MFLPRGMTLSSFTHSPWHRVSTQSKMGRLPNHSVNFYFRCQRRKQLVTSTLAFSGLLSTPCFQFAHPKVIVFWRLHSCFAYSVCFLPILLGLLKYTCCYVHVGPLQVLFRTIPGPSKGCSMEISDILVVWGLPLVTPWMVLVYITNYVQQYMLVYNTILYVLYIIQKTSPLLRETITSPSMFFCSSSRLRELRANRATSWVASSVPMGSSQRSQKAPSTF